MLENFANEIRKAMRSVLYAKPTKKYWAKFVPTQSWKQIAYCVCVWNRLLFGLSARTFNEKETICEMWIMLAVFPFVM